jgi:hypothetical protein
MAPIAPPPPSVALTSPPEKAVAEKPASPPVVVAAPAAVSRPSGDGLAEERLLAAAVRALRAQSDARSALTALNEYQARYPRGRLSVEASVLRVDALTALNRSSEALRVLDRLDLGDIPGRPARQVQRGELRASGGRWQEALADFEWVLSHAISQDQSLAERALWGRADCRAHLGDQAGARSDAEDYVRRFATGRFAAQAARLLTPTTAP